LGYFSVPFILTIFGSLVVAASEGDTTNLHHYVAICSALASLFIALRPDCAEKHVR